MIAVVALVACLAIGGGATYCVDQGIDPMRAFGGALATHRNDERPRERRQKAVAATASAAETASSAGPAVGDPSSPTDRRSR